MMVAFLSQLFVIGSFLAFCGLGAGHKKSHVNSKTESSSSTPANIIFIMLDDLGRTDIGSYGSEWETPNIDSFLESSVTLTNHYVGYVCSVSRSQFLTGRLSFHGGFGALDAFDINRLGYIPFQTPMLQEYLKLYGDYATYGIGKWQLGGQVYDSFPAARGFDHFYGFNGGKQDYYTKETGGGSNKFVDFWEDYEPTTAWCGEYSTDQYFSKMMQVIEEHNNEYDGTKPFYIYLGIQAIHDPFPVYDEHNMDSWSEYYKDCYQKYNSAFDDFDSRLGVCEAMLGIDSQLGVFLDFIKNNEDLQKNNIWENTLIVFTSDNGGSIDKGSCNYPFRGGKNTFYQGNTNVLAAVGGGLLPESQQGIVLDGLISNTDWVPTLLAFANIIPTDQEMIQFDADSNYLSLDGYNIYNYLIKSSESNSYQPMRDHIIFHLQPSLTDDTNDFTKDISTYLFDDFEEIVIIFYDEYGTLWKYINALTSENVIGDATVNSGWCVSGANKENTYELLTNEEYSERVNGIFKLSSDIGETNNLYEMDRNGFIQSLKPIIEEKVSYFTSLNDNLNAKYLFGSFNCFFDSESYFHEAENAAIGNGKFWVPYFEDTKHLFKTVSEDCGLDPYHPVYGLFTNFWSLPNDVTEFSVSDSNDARRLKMKNIIETYNQRVPKKVTENEGQLENVALNEYYNLYVLNPSKNMVAICALLVVVSIVLFVTCMKRNFVNKMNGYERV